MFFYSSSPDVPFELLELDPELDSEPELELEPELDPEPELELEPELDPEPELELDPELELLEFDELDVELEDSEELSSFLLVSDSSFFFLSNQASYSVYSCFVHSCVG